jgi:uncharacterized protein YcfL
MNKLLAVVLTACALAGCASPRQTGPIPAANDPIPLEAYPKITVPYALAPYIVAAPTTVVEGGVLKVTTPIRLTSNPGQWAKVQYRYIFLDSRGLPVRSQPEWQPATLEPHQQVFLSANSLDSNATDWRLEIRPQR